MAAKLGLTDLPLRTKVIITVVGAGIALLGASTYLSFRYWKGEALAAAEQQALLAGSSVRPAVESALARGRLDDARRNLRSLAAGTPVERARVYAADGTILVSADAAEEGRRTVGAWIPPARSLPAGGVVRGDGSADAVRAFLPVASHEAAILEVEFSVAALTAAMDRGVRLGIGLLVGSLLALVAIFLTMLEREVVGPLHRVDRLLADANGGARRGEDELGRIEASVGRLLEVERERERELAAQRRQLAAQAGLAQVGQLAAEMAHEFKRPLSSVSTALELIRQEYVLDPAQQDVLSAVDAQLGHLSGTIRDLLSLARPAELEVETVELHPLLDGALAQLAGRAGWEDVVVECDYDPQVGAVRGEPRRLEQAVLNLLTNALEAMPGGGRLALRTRSAGSGWIELEVADTGAGIPPDKLDAVLRPFYSTKPQGTGLGLPLVARIVDAHEGRLTLESEPGRGTVVRVHLPVRAGEPAPAEAAP